MKFARLTSACLRLILVLLLIGEAFFACANEAAPGIPSSPPDHSRDSDHSQPTVLEKLRGVAAGTNMIDRFELTGLWGESKSEVIEMYRRASKAETKLIFTWALMALPPDDLIATQLIETVKAEYPGTMGTWSNAKLPKASLSALGIVAASSNVAFDFLWEGVSPGLWNNLSTVTDGRPLRLHSAAISDALEAIGSSGRADAYLLLERLRAFGKTDDGQEYVQIFSASILTAYFAADMTTQHGVGYYRDLLLNSEEARFEAQSKWGRTERGKTLHAWQMEIRAHKSKELLPPQ